MKFAYACDDNYAPLTAISAVSLLEHNPNAEILLLGCRLRKESIELVRSRVERKGGTFCYLDVSEFIAEVEKLHVGMHVSPAVYSRIFIPSLLSNEHGRVLYLDCDTLVVGSLAALESIELHGHPLALGHDAVHPAYYKVISLPKNRPYYNSGVCLIDLDAWRSSDCTSRLLDELHHPHGRNPLGDQDVIVRVLNDEIEPLERKWNFLSQFILFGYGDRPVVYHFSGNTLGRPWFTSSRHPLRAEYLRTARNADLLDYANQVKPMAFEYRLQWFLWRILPLFVFKPICNLMYRVHIFITYGLAG